jgi:hypothetical protein
MGVNSISYAISELPLSKAEIPLLLQADDGLARLDERLRTSPLASGWRERIAFAAACANRHLDRELVHLEELVLLDAGALPRVVTPELSGAYEVLKVWREADHSDPHELLRAERPGTAETRTASVTNAPDYFYDPDWGEAERLAAWRRVLAESGGLPPLLASFLVWDAWLELQPDQRGGWRASLIAALCLRDRQKTRHFLLPLDLGARHARYRRFDRQTVGQRLVGYLEWVRTTVDRSNRELDRLGVVADGLALKCKGKRKNSHLPALVTLLLSRPVISVPITAKALGVSNQAVDVMLKQLGSYPRELTGRTRYRVWSVA